MPRPSLKPPERLQGTDGIRREVRLQSGFPRLSPQQVFLRHGVITEEFFERYAYAHVSLLMKRKKAKPGAGVVVGWDPRDPDGVFTGAVVRGVRKAGADAWVIGTAPTPLVPMTVLAWRAAGGLMVTASHNPKEHNGIKIFLAWRGMKLLPENDWVLTRAVLKQKSLAKVKMKGRRLDYHREAMSVFTKFHLDPNNSWAEGVDFKDTVLVVDPARGSLSGIAADIFRETGFGEVHEVNHETDGNVNLRSGVADLEGVPVVTAGMIGTGGRFARHPALTLLFELGRRHRSKIAAGRRKVSGAVFDADGDRFYRLDYHPRQDVLLVQSGDETAFLQARYLMRRAAGRWRGAAYLHTVESDLNCGVAARRLGLKCVLAPVGDKWILWRVAGLILDTRLKTLALRAKKHGTVRLRARLDAVRRQWRRFKTAPRFDTARLEKIEAALDAVESHLPGLSGTGLAVDLFPFAVGSEETGHNITTGWLEVEPNVFNAVHCGNGLKSALNTFAATQTLFADTPPEKYFAALAAPFERGFKATLYAYHIEQTRFCRGSKLWRRVQADLKREAKRLGWRARARAFAEDPDMLYLELARSGRPGAVFVRNSGTENKISVNLRGGRAAAGALTALGESALRLLMREMKDPAHPLFSVERQLIEKMNSGHLPEARVGSGAPQHALMALGKQGLAEPSPRGYRLTPRGDWYRQMVTGLDPAGSV